MPSDWVTSRITDIARVNPPRSATKGSSVPFIDMAALPCFGRDIPSEGISVRPFGGSGSRFQRGDTLVARITPCLENGKTALVSCIPDGITAQGSTEFVVLSPKEASDELFLYYLAISPAFREYAIQRMEGTSGRQRVSGSNIGDFEFECPPPEERKMIGSALGALDDRVASLRGISSTLEQIAMAIFKSWFIDFDPVRAKSEGREPEGMSADIAALFPCEFVDSEMGAIPKGWSTRSLYDMATYINGAAYKAFEPNAEQRGLPIIKIAELKAGVTSQTAYSDVSMPAKYRIETGDILFSWSGNPDTSIDTFVWAHDPAWLNQHIFRVLPHAEGERSFVLQTLKYLRPVFADLARNKQTTGLGHVTVSDMKRLQVIWPDKVVAEQFDRLISPIHQRVFNNQVMSKSLAELRDSLLPRLLSGAMTVPA